MKGNRLKDRSILVTGGAGFIGSHLVERLLDDNEVFVLDNFSSGIRKSLLPLIDRSNFHLLEADLLDYANLEPLLRGKDMVFHLSANPIVRLGIEDTRIHLEQNVLATYNLLEAMRKIGIREIAFTSTSAVYGEARVVPTPEDYGPMLPISLYGASKLSCEALITSYCHNFGMQSWIFRFANIVGERGMHGVVADFIRKLKRNPKKLEILGSGKQRKSYMDVKECIDAMIHCVENSGNETNLFNIGSSDHIDVKEIADIVVEMMGLENVDYVFKNEIDGRGWKGDVKFMLLSIEKIKRLGWTPKLSSAQAIKAAVEALIKDLANR